ncbi:MAG TPA: glycosyltransferase [Rhizomicrobium sp.]|nr:glycosyltransferase [Rhizomicrobium sp.]
MVVAPLFSVVIPTYNRAGVLKEVLKSVLAQSCQDFEIVVVDDGSKDNPKKIIDEIADARIRFRAQENRGASAARNAGIDLALGRYVAFLDSDDEFLPHHLETMRCLLENSPNTAAYARIILDRGNGRTLVKPPRALRPGENMATYLLCDRGFVPTITLVVEREMAKRVHYDERVSFGDDKDFAIRLWLAGCEFEMAEAPGARCSDIADPSRLSAGRKIGAVIEWIDRLRPGIPARAYHGYRGWVVAKGLVTTDPFGALKLYLNALFRGCYVPRMAAVIFLQIFLPDSLYRGLADRIIGWMRK